jgi:hypothetical protein
MEFLPIIPSRSESPGPSGSRFDWASCVQPLVFVAQLLVVPLLGSIATFTLGMVFIASGTRTTADLNALVTVTILAPIVMTFCLGFSACSIEPRYFSTARYIWILPVGYFVYCVGHALIDYPVRVTMLGFFVSGALLPQFTIPVAHCSVYSLAAFLGTRSSSLFLVSHRGNRPIRPRCLIMLN